MKICMIIALPLFQVPGVCCPLRGKIEKLGSSVVGVYSFEKYLSLLFMPFDISYLQYTEEGSNCFALYF